MNNTTLRSLFLLWKQSINTSIFTTQTLYIIVSAITIYSHEPNMAYTFTARRHTISTISRISNKANITEI